MARTAFAIGRWGENLVAKVLGYRRVPASGSRWPHKEDLTRMHSRQKELAQMKTTEGDAFLKHWLALERHANIEGAEPRWYDVVSHGGEVFVFERTLVYRANVGIGGVQS